MSNFRERQAAPPADFSKWEGIQSLVCIGALEAIVDMLVATGAASNEAREVPGSWVSPGEAVEVVVALDS